MGTQHLICVVKGGEYRVAQRGLWDGYVEGQGKNVIGFLTAVDLKRFSSQVDKIKVLSAEEVRARWAAAEALGEPRFSFGVPFEVFHLSRRCSSQILGYVENIEAPEVCLSLDFAGDSLFCEFAYVVNLDTQSLEIFKGFNRAPLTEGERFYGFEQRPANQQDFVRRSASGKSYYPIKHFRTLRFTELGANTVPQLLEQLRWAETED
jgi:hypothetical protein